MFNILFFGSTSDFAFNTFAFNTFWFPSMRSLRFNLFFLNFKSTFCFQEGLGNSGQPLCNKSLNKIKVLNAKSEVEPKKSILSINFCVDLN